jgi:hypothetical protein
VPLLCGHGVWGSGSAGDSGAMACRADLYLLVYNRISIESYPATCCSFMIVVKKEGSKQHH